MNQNRPNLYLYEEDYPAPKGGTGLLSALADFAFLCVAAVVIKSVRRWR